MEENKPAERPLYTSLRAIGILMAMTGLLAGIATFKEGAIVGGGLFSAGLLMWLAGFGSRRGWKYCPVLPLVAAIASLLVMSGGCILSLAVH